MRRATLFTARGAAALIAAALLAASCSSPEDESWLVISSFSQGGTTVAVIGSDLEDESADLADITFTNLSTSAKGTAPGIGISIRRLRVDYSLRAFTFPSYTYRVSAYLPANTSEESRSTVTLSDVAIVPLELKEAILEGGIVPASIIDEPFTVKAVVTAFARTDDGKDLEVEGGINVAFGATVTPPATETIVGTPVLSSSGTTTTVGNALNFTTTTVTSSLGHQVEYVFSWGDTTATATTTTTASHAWANVSPVSQPYQVTVQGRCRTHPTVTSPISNIIAVTVQ